MSAPDTSHVESPEAVETTTRIVGDALKVIAGLLVGALLGLVIAGYAGWLPTLRLC